MEKEGKRLGGSRNPIIFHDYDNFVAKFQETPKTTDDCYTPEDVYEAVVRYVSTIHDMTDKVILRPFFPGGDYEHAEYPDNGVVIDNPPFSMFTKIVSFYTYHGIPFFLFGPGLTITTACKFCTAIIVYENVTFENGAKININFASNLFGDTIIMTAPLLDKMLAACPSQKPSNPLPSYEYPDELLSVSDLQIICRKGEEFSVSRDEAVIIRNLDHHPTKRGLFGDHLLIGTAKAKEKKEKKEKKKKLRNRIGISLSERERKIVDILQAKR